MRLLKALTYISEKESGFSLIASGLNFMPETWHYVTRFPLSPPEKKLNTMENILKIFWVVSFVGDQEHAERCDQYLAL